MDVSHGGFYDWDGRKPSRRSQANQILKAHIQESFHGSDRTYGSPRVWRDMVDWGYVCSENRIARLMKELGLKARPKRRMHPGDMGIRQQHCIAPNLLERQFEAPGPNQRWVADFTYISTGEGWLYLAVVLDLYSRLAVGWSMSPNMTAQLVMDALMMAIWRRGKPKALVHHSDQGSQYTSEDFRKLLEDQGIQCSMSRRGDCWDNAAMESFFSSLKMERVYRRRYATRDEARADLFQYIEQFYNPKRRHSTLGGISPVEYEKRYAGLTACP
jgi:putative transposase